MNSEWRSRQQKRHRNWPSTKTSTSIRAPSTNGQRRRGQIDAIKADVNGSNYTATFYASLLLLLVARPPLSPATTTWVNRKNNARHKSVNYRLERRKKKSKKITKEKDASRFSSNERNPIGRKKGTVQWKAFVKSTAPRKRTTNSRLVKWRKIQGKNRNSSELTKWRPTR